MEDFSALDLRNSEDRNDLKIVEGILIESYRRKHGDFPKWNRVGGSINGQGRSTLGNYYIVKSFTHQSPLVAHSTLREISSNPTIERYENYLFAVRFYMLYFGMSLI